MKKLGIIIPLILILSACGGKKEESVLSKIEVDRFTVSTEKVEIRNISQDLLLSGSVKAWEEATIYPRVDGKLLKNVLHEGDKVTRNQNIALIERDEVGAVYEPVVVPSTLTGVIGRTFLDPGANVTKSTPIALVVNQENVRILIEIPERYVGKIHMGQEAVFYLEAYGDKEFKAQIYKLSPVVDMDSRVVKAELKASNKEGLIKAGMFAKIKLLLDEEKNIPSVSLPFVQKDSESGKNHVFVVEGDTVAKKTVPAAIASASHQAIPGVPAGTELASVVFGLKDGSKIKIENI